MAEPPDGTIREISCPTCDTRHRSVFANGHWVLPPHENRAGNRCPTTRKKPA